MPSWLVFLGMTLRLAPSAKDWVEIVQIVLVLLVLGISALIPNWAKTLGFQFDIPAIVPPLVFFALLVFLAGLRQFKELEALKTIRPLKATSVDSDGLDFKFLRLTVHNPNDMVIKDAYVAVVSYQAKRYRTAEAAIDFPPPGYKFPLSSHEGAGMTFNIAPHSDRHIDIAFMQADVDNRFFTPHLSHDTNTTRREAWYAMPPGVYEAIVEMASESDSIPLRYGTVLVNLIDSIRTFGGEVTEQQQPTAGTAMSRQPTV